MCEQIVGKLCVSKLYVWTSCVVSKLCVRKLSV